MLPNSIHQDQWFLSQADLDIFLSRNSADYLKVSFYTNHYFDIMIAIRSCSKSYQYALIMHTILNHKLKHFW